jgi:hypothetical protein
VYWQDGPTRQASRTGQQPCGAPLPAEELRFHRSDSAQAVALGWLAAPAPDSASPEAVEAWREDTGYPQARFDATALAVADLLARLGRGDISQIGALRANAVPPIQPPAQLSAGPELTGQVTSLRWPAGEPPQNLLGLGTLAAATAPVPGCQRCGKRLRPAQRGRPAKFCSGACRVAAHRAAAA